MRHTEPHERLHAHDSHDDDHDHLHGDEHTRQHAATLPPYVQRGGRPTSAQIIAFGAAGGMIPCPASVTVMLLALSIGQVGLGLFTVFGFSLGLAVTLVGVGLLVVAGLNRLAGTSRLRWVSRRATLISAAVVILSGLFALFPAHA